MEKDIQQIQQENKEKMEQERAMQNVTCPKLAKTLVKLQEVNNEFYNEFDRAYNIGARELHDDMENDFFNAYDQMQSVITNLMTKILQVELRNAVPSDYDK